MSETNELKTIYGIDLGTTYSAISCLDEAGKPEILTNTLSGRITPSVVFFQQPDESGKIQIDVGQTAKEAGTADPDNVVAFIKQQMGSDWKKEFFGMEFTPQMISAEILKKLVKDAKEMHQKDVKDVVITCPAYFGDKERAATKEAGKLAGLNVIKILEEPIAAALHYGLNKSEGDRTSIVYDLGGGTFDVAVISIKGNKYTVVCSDGDHQLGGKLWDERLVNLIANKCAEQAGVDAQEILDDKETRYELMLLAEKAKQALTPASTWKGKVVFGGGKETVEITREEFDEITKDLLARTEEFTQAMIDMAKKKGTEKINDFLLVGGSTKMPQVMAMVKEKFAPQVENEPINFDPDEAVAKGAATFGTIQAIQIFIEQGGDKGDIDVQLPGAQGDGPVITTVTSRSFGIFALQNDKEIIFNMIQKQTEVPCSYDHVFGTNVANATLLPLKIYTNNLTEKVAEPGDSEILGEAKMELTPGLPANAPILVKFEIKDDGMLYLEATDQTNNKSINTTFKIDGSLSQEQIEQQIKETALRTQQN